MHSKNSTAPPSYDDLFGTQDGCNPATQPGPSSHFSVSPRSSPRNSNAGWFSGLFQSSNHLSSVPTNGPSRPPGSPSPSHEEVARRHSHHGSRPSDQYGDQNASRAHHSSLHGHRSDPSAPLPDMMDNLRMAAEAVVDDSSSRNSKNPNRSSRHDGGSSSNRYDESPRSSRDHHHESSRRQWDDNQEEHDSRTWFAAVDENNDGYITTAELQQALLNDNYSRFSMDTINMILKMFDKDFNNRIDFIEFSQIKRFVTEWKATFDRYDVDRSGTIDSNEIRQALAGMSYTLSVAFCEKLSRRFSQVTPPKVNLDAFIYICATISAIHKANPDGRKFEEKLLKWIR